jgi:acyl carrier protein phosphodiesterase
MNFLAHAYLSGNNDKILIGNFIGDFVKGKKFNDYDEEVQKGIIIHREIDRFTDTHKVVQRSKSILTEKYRHYSGVIVDIFYDHILAKNWGNYHQNDLLSYTNQVYDKLLAHEQMLPSRVKQMLKYMIPDNWLYNYSFLEGIQRVLNGMSNRTKFDSGMEHAVEDLEIHFDEFQDDFVKFFPDLINFVDSLQNKQE